MNVHRLLNVNEINSIFKIENIRVGILIFINSQDKYDCDYKISITQHR